MESFEPFDGAILVDKPAGPTSHDIVDAVRHHFQLKKVGHCGTLDPNATGLMILVLGRATRLSEKLMSSDKVYEGVIKFGEAKRVLGFDPMMKLVGCFGRIRENKGTDRFVDAMIAILPRHPGWQTNLSVRREDIRPSTRKRCQIATHG